jgi:hypothetical protein
VIFVFVYYFRAVNSIEIITINVSNLHTKFGHDMDYFKDYLDFNKEKLRERQRKINSQLDEDIKENPSLEQGLIEIYDDDFKRIPAYFYHSSVILLYSLLEHYLNEICNKIITKTRFPFSLKDFAGNNIILKSKIFLQKIDIEMNYMEKEWNEIIKLQRIRNLIVHHDSHIQFRSDQSMKQSSDYKLFQEFKSIEVRPSGQFVILEGDVLYSFRGLISLYFNYILDQVKTKKFKLFGLDHDKYQKDIYDNFIKDKSLFGTNNQFWDDLPF